MYVPVVLVPVMVPPVALQVTPFVGALAKVAVNTVVVPASMLTEDGEIEIVSAGGAALTEIAAEADLVGSAREVAVTV
jgi:hypothetical protein